MDRETALALAAHIREVSKEPFTRDISNRNQNVFWTEVVELEKDGSTAFLVRVSLNPTYHERVASAWTEMNINHAKLPSHQTKQVIYAVAPTSEPITDPMQA